MTLLSASRLPIARHCRWPFREDVKFTEAPRLYDNEGGTRIHDAFSSYIDSHVFPPLDPDQRLCADRMAEFWGQRVNTDAWKSEAAFALDPFAHKARFLGTHINRQYAVTGDELPCTVDYLGVEGGMVVVGDWKPPYDPHVERASENLQLLAGGAAASYAHGTDGAILEIVRVDEGEAYADRFIATPLVLARACLEIAQIKGAIPGSPAVAGTHCAYCPALGSCPETSRVVRGAMPAAKAVWSTEFISEENDALLVEEMAALEKVLDSVKEKIKERARERGGIRLKDGKIYKAIVSRRTSADTKKIAEFLGDKYGSFVRTVEYEQFRKVNA